MPGHGWRYRATGARGGAALYRAAGYDKEQLAFYQGLTRQLWPGDLSPAGEFSPAGRPGDHHHRWSLLAGNRGQRHSPEHAAPYCPALKLLISGDQVLPRITPNVSVFPTEPSGDPLAEWLSSSARIREILPDDVLCYRRTRPLLRPARAPESADEAHNRDLRSLFDHLDQPRRAVDCFPPLFSREIDQDSLGLATGETMAHLNCLLGRRRITRRRDAQGVDWYQQIPETAGFDEEPPPASRKPRATWSAT